jgi:hypothetical protein
LGLFSGMGVRDGVVVHVDARHLAPQGPFFSTATPSTPCVFPD